MTPQEIVKELIEACRIARECDPINAMHGSPNEIIIKQLWLANSQRVIEESPARIEALIQERTASLRAEVERLRAALEKRQVAETLAGN